MSRSRTLWAFAALVAAGSALGTLIRAAIELAFPHASDQWPWATFWINLVGSFLLGALLETLSRSGDDAGWRRRLRLGLGTGVLGGFTTYSTFVLEIDQLARAGQLALGVAYAFGSIVLGVIAAGLGVAAASMRPTARQDTPR